MTTRRHGIEEEGSAKKASSEQRRNPSLKQLADDRRLQAWPSAHGPSTRRPILVTGGAGFIGTNLAARLAADGHRVRVFDSLARPGVERNLNWLVSEFGSQIDVEVADVRDHGALQRAVSDARRVYHLAAQVAVTTSLVSPRDDFEVNLASTFALLEALRHLPSLPPLLFTSTNKVYGNLDGVSIAEGPSRYQPVDPQIHAHGIDESQSLDFKSPYGCSKGGADQYVLDFAHCYHLPVVVFRMSCIYGPHQFGNEDQGWVAHFVLRALADQSITIFGDGKQVRDILWVEDLVEAMLLAHERLDRTSGRAFNIGGGPRHTTSLLELLQAIEQQTGRRLRVARAAWRKGDQRYYVSDVRKFARLTGWRPRVTPAEGVASLCCWLRENHVADLLHRGSETTSVDHLAVPQGEGSDPSLTAIPHRTGS